MPDFYDKEGIVHWRFRASTSQKRSAVEWKHQHILNEARALYFKLITYLLLGDCVFHVVYLINRNPSPIVQNITPFELLHHCVPSYNHLKVFDYLAYASTLAFLRSKFDPRATKCVFLGYSPGIKHYMLYDWNTYSTFVSKMWSFMRKSFISLIYLFLIWSFIASSSIVAMNEEAAKYACWRVSMNEESMALQVNRTWHLTNLPPGKASYKA